MKRAQKGFVIPLVLMLISIAILLATNIYRHGSLFVPFMNTILKRNQAKELALSGIQIAMSQLAQTVEPKKKEQKAGEPITPPSQQQESKEFLSRLLPNLNRLQAFKLSNEIDGIEGSIQIVLSCEEGKINLNTLYDFGRSKFMGEGQPQKDAKKTVQLIAQRIQKSMGISTNLFESFEKFFKQRQYKVNDATELLPFPGFNAFAQTIFYTPPTSKSKSSERPLYLLDLFTVYGNGTLQPWLLSDSVRGLLEMRRVMPDTKQRKKMSQDMLKTFKPSINLAQDWKNSFQPLYGIEFNRLPKGIEAFFDRSFDPRFFSVVSYGVVGDITQRLYAILERVRHIDKNRSWYDVKIKKLYWI